MGSDKITAALREAGYDVRQIDGDDLLRRVERSPPPDVVYNALHGPYGEDGCIQASWMPGVRHTHSGVRLQPGYNNRAAPVQDGIPNPLRS